MVDRAIVIVIDSHALERARERGTDEDEIRETVCFGESFPAKKNRMEFRGTFRYDAFWEGNYYRNKQVHAYAAEQANGWYVVTVIVKFF